MEEGQVIGSVRQWVESLVVEKNLCPFAKRELVKNRVRIDMTEAATEVTERVLELSKALGEAMKRALART